MIRASEGIRRSQCAATMQAWDFSMPPTSRCSLPRWRERYVTNRGLPSAAPPQPKGTTADDADVADIMNKRKKHGGVSHRLTHRSGKECFLLCENLCSSVAQSKSLRSRIIFLSFASV